MMNEFYDAQDYEDERPSSFQGIKSSYKKLTGNTRRKVLDMDQHPDDRAAYDRIKQQAVGKPKRQKFIQDSVTQYKEGVAGETARHLASSEGKLDWFKGRERFGDTTASAGVIHSKAKDQRKAPKSSYTKDLARMADDASDRQRFGRDTTRDQAADMLGPATALHASIPGYDLDDEFYDAQDYEDETAQDYEDENDYELEY
jgi:hypothetical protein